LNIESEIERLHQYLRGAYHSTHDGDIGSLPLLNAMEQTFKILEAYRQMVPSQMKEPNFEQQRGVSVPVDMDRSKD